MNLDLNTIKKPFFLGIGGIGISAIARLFLLEGKDVVGSDISESVVVDELRHLGISITIGQSKDAIPKDTDAIIYSLAIPKYDPELYTWIQNSGIPAYSYPEMLGIVTKGKYTIAVSGTHGKTTTTAMIGKMLIDTKQDPSIIVGSLLKDVKSNLVVGQSQYFVAEACEYERSFLQINPTITVITNIEEDHLDYYKDITDIVTAFREFVNKIPENGFVICNPALPAVQAALIEVKGTIIDYTQFVSKVPKLKIPGAHNIADAACALAIADVLHIPLVEAEKSLMEFSGTWRRFDHRGTLSSGVEIYDDYAHHPTEIKATLSSFRELYPRENGYNVIVVFQPHLYSRTKAFFNDFAQSFGDADEVIFLPIFAAREEPDPEVTSESLAERTKEFHNLKIAALSFPEAEKLLKARQLDNKTIVVTMGAGKANEIGDHLLSQ